MFTDWSFFVQVGFADVEAFYSLMVLLGFLEVDAQEARLVTRCQC
jgi:hypothetical protein